MTTDLYLISKYWKHNKKQFFKVILSVFILVVMLIVTILIEQTECRRKYDNLKHMYGASNFVFYDVPENIYKELAAYPEVENIGRVYSCGKLGISGRQFTYGVYEDQVAEQLDYLEISNGHMPRNKGEAAIYDYAVKELFPDKTIEDILDSEISLNEYDFNNNFIRERKINVVGIIKGYEARELTELSELWETYSDIPMPMIFLNPDDCIDIESSHSFSLITHTLNEYENKESAELALSFRQKCADEYGLYVLGNNSLSIVTSDIMSYQANNEMFQSVYSTDTMTIIKYFSVIAVIISAISMFGILYSVMQERIKSLNLVKVLGYSKLSLMRLFIIEWFLLYIVGFLLGIIVGILIYEAIISIQYFVWQMPLLQAFNLEWCIKQITNNPFIMAFICSVITFLFGYIFCVMKFTLFNKKITMNRKKCRSFHTLKKALSGDIFTNTMQIISFSLVVLTATAFYSYYSLDGKGNSYFSNPEMNGDSYYEYALINMKSENIDLCIYNNSISEAIGPMVSSNYGLTIDSQDNIADIDGIQSVQSYGINLAANIVYPKESNDVPDYIKNNLECDFSEDMEKFYNAENTAYYQMPMIMCSDDAVEKLSFYVVDGEIGKYKNGITLVIFENIKCPYNIGDTIPMIAIQATNDGLNIQERNDYDVIVEAIAVIPDSAYENDKINYNIFCNEQGICMAFTSHTNLNTYKNGYDYSYIKFSKSDSTDKILSQIKNNITPSMKVQIRSLEECNDAFHRSRIERYLSIIFIMLILIIMTIVGYISLISMKIQNSKNNIAVLRSIGFNKYKCYGIFLINNLKNTVFSCLIGSLFVLMLKALMKAKYNEAITLVEKYGMMGTDYDKYAMITEIENTYLLDYEMYNVPIIEFILLVTAFLVLITIVSTLCIAYKEYRFNISDELSNNTRE